MTKSSRCIAYTALVGSAVAFASLCAHAHTSVLAQATEAVTADNALRIGHGCEVPGGSARPVLAQSVLVPTVSPVLTTSDGSPVAGLGGVITQGGLAGLAKPVQDGSIFQTQQVKIDTLGNVIGWSSNDGSLDVKLLGRQQFQFAAPAFVASTCVKRLLVKLAVADVCGLTPGAPIAPGNVNLWIPDNGSQYALAGKSQNVSGIGEPPTLIVNRNLASNPLPPSCSAGIDVTVTPSPADVDANLRIAGVWGPTGGGLPTDSVPVIEFYNAHLDHYFISHLADEIAKLDDGTVIQGWERTGRRTRTFRTAQSGTSPVCRYYIPPASGDSHFFGRGAAECAATGQKNPSFVLEDSAFMQMYLPSGGACPAGTTTIYRVFSNRADANHRYLTDTATRDVMVADGWLAEGDGSNLVVMCAPK